MKQYEKKNLTVIWKKAKNASGYQIQYAFDKKFKKSAKKKRITKYSKKGFKIRKLKSKKKYFVRVRAYRIANGRTVYGKWSKKKSITVK